MRHRKLILREGYAARHYQDEILEVAKRVAEWKQEINLFIQENEKALDKIPRDPTKTEYMYVSNEPFLGNGISKQQVFGKNYMIAFTYYWSYQQGRCEGAYLNGHLDDDCYVIWIKIYPNTRIAEIIEALTHEVTHLLDAIIHYSKNIPLPAEHASLDMLMSGPLPYAVKEVLYILWTKTEFNAWQASQNLGGWYDAVTRLSSCLEALNTYNDVVLWRNVQQTVCSNWQNKRVSSMNPAQFKRYFLSTSRRLLENMKRKLARRAVAR